MYITPLPPSLLPPLRGTPPDFSGGRGDYIKKFFLEFLTIWEEPHNPVSFFLPQSQKAHSLYSKAHSLYSKAHSLYSKEPSFTIQRTVLIHSKEHLLYPKPKMVMGLKNFFWNFLEIIRVFFRRI